jgi:hypothetical protein
MMDTVQKKSVSGINVFCTISMYDAGNEYKAQIYIAECFTLVLYYRTLHTVLMNVLVGKHTFKEQKSPYFTALTNHGVTPQ